MKAIDLFELNKLIWLLEERLGFDCYASQVDEWKQRWSLHVYDRGHANVERQNPFHREDCHYIFLVELLNGMKMQWSSNTRPPNTMLPQDPRSIEYCYIIITGIEDG